jgi:hypothetical protein
MSFSQTIVRRDPLSGAFDPEEADFDRAPLVTPSRISLSKESTAPVHCSQP